MSEIAELIERLRATPEKHEERMQQWDYARKLVADGHTGSHPRDIVESVIDALEMDGSEAADALATLTARVAELERERDAYLQGVRDADAIVAGHAARADAAEARLAKAVEALSEGLDLCARARRMAGMDVERTEMYLRNPDMTRSATIPLWAEEQYQQDLAAWEGKARALARAALSELEGK